MGTGRMIAVSAGALILMLCAGCWNGGNDSISLGTVSIGQQLIDLKAALDQEAISQEEYQTLKEAMVSLGQLCSGNDE